MKQVKARVVRHQAAGGDYRIITLRAPSVASRARPGQFVHLLVPRLDTCVLRRPFSIYRATGQNILVLYKTVGQGTRALAETTPGETVNAIGPLGNGFPTNRKGIFPVLVAGGYGVAPFAFLARRLAGPGIVFIGGASAKDILCADEFRRMGWKVQTTTEDGTLGRKGLVTTALDEWLARNPHRRLEFFACGPDGLLKAVAGRARSRGEKAWLSLDTHMGCGLGACLACVVKIRDAKGGTTWARVCRDGPVFEAAEVVW